MIVGLRKRRASKGFYDLGVLLKREQKVEQHTTYPVEGGPGTTTYSRTTNFCFVQTFSPHSRGRAYKFQTDHTWVPYYLVEEICNNAVGKCGKEKLENCPHRFKCLTTRVIVKD